MCIHIFCMNDNQTKTTDQLHSTMVHQVQLLRGNCSGMTEDGGELLVGGELVEHRPQTGALEDLGNRNYLEDASFIPYKIKKISSLLNGDWKYFKNRIRQMFYLSGIIMLVIYEKP